MIYIGADHRGFKLKEFLKKHLTKRGLECEDVGAFELDEHDDYPRYARAVCEHIHEIDDRGIVICGSGVGVDEAANKMPGIRAGLAIDATQIESARHDDDINVLALAADFTSEDEAQEIVNMFLDTEFSGDDRYVRRIGQLEDIEEEF